MEYQLRTISQKVQNNSTGAAIDSAPVSLFSGTAYPNNLSVGIAASGGFVVSYYNTGTTYTAYARVYNSSNVLQAGSPITVAAATSPSSIYSSALSVAADGSFVVAWESYASSNYQLQALRYTATGALRDTSTPLQVLAPQSQYFYGSSVAEQADGSFEVAWNQSYGGNQIWARRFNASATGATAVQVSTVLTGSSAPAVAVDSQGDFGVEWSQNNGIWGRFYNAASQPESDPFQVDIGDPGSASGYGGMVLAADAQGDFRSAWQSQQGSNYEVLTERLQLNQAPVNTVTIPTVNVLVSAAPSTINLASYFGDVDIPYRDSISYSVAGNSNSALVSTGISGSTLTLTYANGASGTANLVLTVTDTTGLSTSVNLGVNVQSSGLVLLPIPDQSISQGGTITFTAVGSDLTNPTATLTYSLDPGAPSGASINSTTGAFSWTTTGVSPSLYPVTVRVTDNAGSPLTYSQVVHLTILNNAPVLTHTALSGYTERDTAQANLGVLVSSLTGGITDADSGALQGIAIVATDQAHGTLQYSTNGGSTWTNVGAVSTTSALLLASNSSTRVRLVPTDTYLGTITDAITFRAWDQTSGTAGSYVDTTTNGGSTSFSTATDTVSMTIDPAVGAQTQVDTDATGTHTPVGTALDGQGNSATAWLYNGNLYARGYQRSGTPIGNQFQVNAASTTATSAAVAINSGGTSVYAWTTLSGGTYTVWAQRFNNTTGGYVDFSPVSLFTSTGLSNLSVGIATNNSIVVTYQVLSGSTTSVMAKLYSSSNTLTTTVTVASATSPSTVANPALSVAGDGTFSVAWQSLASSNYSLLALRYTAAGGFRDTSTPITVLAAQGSTVVPSLAEQTDGGFAIGWQQGTQVWARHYTSTLTATSAVQVATSTSYAPSVATDAVGDFGVAWTSGSTAPNVWGRFFTSSTAAPESDAFPIDTGDPGLGYGGPALAADAQGDFTAAWPSQQSSSTQVLSQRLQLNQTPTVVTIPPQYAAADATTATLNLANYFSDVDVPYGDQLTYTASSSNTSLVTTSVSGSLLTLNYPAPVTSAVTITVTATDLLSHQVSTTFTVNQNTAPVLTHTALAGSAERDTAQPNLGVLVSSLTGGISDADTSAAKGIAIVGVDTAHGTLQYSTNGGNTWTTITGVSSTNALLLAADANTRLRIVPTDTFLGTITDAITFRAWDQSKGAAGSYVDTTNSGSHYAFSTATDTVSMTIDPAVGAMTQANSDSTGYHTAVGTALDGQGNSVVAWTYNSNLIAQSYSRSGTQLNSQFQVNTAGTSVSNASVAMNASGTAIFVWSVYSAGTYTVYSQRFNNSTGAAIDASPVSLFSGTAYPNNLSVGIAASGGFVVSYYNTGTAYTVYARVYNSSNVLQSGSPITVATMSNFDGSGLSVASDGSFVVDWSSYASSNYQMQALRYTATGALRDTSTPLQVVAPQSGYLYGAAIAEQADGSFVVAWEQYVGSNYQVWARRFNSAASGATAVQVSAQTNNAPAVAMDSQGNFGVEWTNGFSPQNVWGRFFNASSQPESDAFLIDASDPGYGYGGLVLAGDTEGDFATAWTSNQGANYQILTQHLQPSQAPVNTTSLPTQRVLTSAPPTTINLANYFSDLDVTYRDSVSYSVTGNTNTGLITTNISGSTLTLTYASGITGAANLTVQATDSTGLGTSASFRTVVQSTPLAIDPIPDQSINRGGTLAFTAVGGDIPNPGATLTYSLDAGAPSGATINSTTGAFSWTTTSAAIGVYPVTVRVTDNASPSLTATQVVNLSVLNNAPVLVQTSLKGLAPRDSTQPNPGMLVSSLIGGITDADSGALKGIAIVGVDQLQRHRCNTARTTARPGPTSVPFRTPTPCCSQRTASRECIVSTDKYEA